MRLPTSKDPRDTVQTIRYARADNPALQHEKAYILNYDPPPGVPKSNFVIDYYSNIPIRNLRTAGLSFQANGITMTDLDGCMPREDFDDEAKVEDLYLPQVHAALRRALGADEVYIFDYMIRKREAAFPFQPKGKDKSPQPALSAHIDYTTHEIQGRVGKYFKDRSEEFKGRHFQIVNAWKPLNGPLRDYPMAYCDAKTLDPKSDLLCVDEVFPTVANEVYQVLHNPKHTWYYIPDQSETELAIFAGYDSKRGQDVAVPHCAFDLGDASSGEPRQSIEVRAFAFYADE